MADYINLNQINADRRKYKIKQFFHTVGTGITHTGQRIGVGAVKIKEGVSHAIPKIQNTANNLTKNIAKGQGYAKVKTAENQLLNNILYGMPTKKSNKKKQSNNIMDQINKW